MTQTYCQTQATKRIGHPNENGCTSFLLSLGQVRVGEECRFFSSHYNVRFSHWCRLTVNLDVLSHFECYNMWIIHDFLCDWSSIQVYCSHLLFNFFCSNGVATLLRYKELEKTSFQEPMSVRISGDATETPAVIDSAAILDESDRLSQVGNYLMPFC